MSVRRGKKSRNYGKFAQSIRIGLIFPFLMNTVIPFSVQADSASVSSSTSANDIKLSELDSICKKTLETAKKAQSDQSATNSQKLQYCQAAKSAKEAADAQDIMWKLWAGVAGVCTGACLVSFAGISNQYVCIGVNTAAGITDAVVTQNFMAALMAIGGSGMAYMMNSSMKQEDPYSLASPVPNPSKSPKKDKDVGACLLAAMAAFQTYMSHSGMKSSEKSAKSSLASAKAIDSYATNTVNQSVSTTASSQSNTATVETASSGGSVSSGGSLNSSGSSDSDSTATCSRAKTNQNVGMMIQCAISSNSNLPSNITSPRFANDFKKNSGVDFNDFMTNPKNDNPLQGLATAMGGALSSNQSMKLQAALRDMEQQMPHEMPNSVYSGGRGGGGSGSSGGSDSDLNNLVQGMMNQFLPTQETNSAQNNGMAMVIFANKQMPPSAIAEDKRLSIFDRISFRYYYAGQTLLEVKQ